MQIGFSLSLYPPNNTSKSFKIPSFISRISSSRTWTVHGGLTFTWTIMLWRIQLELGNRIRFEEAF